jgi:hypothetical protein
MNSKVIFCIVSMAILMAVLCLPGSGVPATDEQIVVTQFAIDRTNKNVPEGWKVEKAKGTPNLRLIKEGNDVYLQLKTDQQSSYGVKKEFKVDIKKYPFLHWRWKVTQLPRGGDIRKSDTDDQAIQIYVAFTATGWPAKFNTPVVAYIWDNEAPKGLMIKSPQRLADKVRYIVLRNKTDKLGEWYGEKRNVYEDYKKLFKDINKGEPKGTTQGISFYINSQHTKTQAESFIGEVYFTRE